MEQSPSKDTKREAQSLTVEEFLTKGQAIWDSVRDPNFSSKDVSDFIRQVVTLLSPIPIDTSPQVYHASWRVHSSNYVEPIPFVITLASNTEEYTDNALVLHYKTQMGTSCH